MHAKAKLLFTQEALEVAAVTQDFRLRSNPPDYQEDDLGFCLLDLLVRTMSMLQLSRDAQSQGGCCKE